MSTTETAEIAVREQQPVYNVDADGGISELLEAHQAVLRAGVDLVTAAARAGHILLKLKHTYQKPGTWRTWIEQHLPFTYATAHLYMRCALHEDVIREQGWTRFSQIKGGLAALVPPDHKAKGKTGKGKPEWVKELARDMHGDGMSYRAIAAELQVNPGSVRCWISPEYRQKCQQKVAEINKRRIRAERALREQERELAVKQAVKKAGAALAEAYATAERMQDVLAQAHRETEDSEARRALSLAGEHHRRMRDQIVRALGVAS